MGTKRRSFFINLAPSNKLKIKKMDVIDENGNTVPNQESKRVLAGILAILIGSIGIHKFVLGYTKEGIIQIIATIITCGFAGIIPFIEGIIYLTKSDDDFIETYQVNHRGWF